jgi:TetR/AcrR family transcriptional regulator
MATRLTRRERERQRHRREILAAAQDLFSRNGFDKTAMAEIAERAEFAVGTLYTLFKDKNALYRALILDTVQRFEQALTAVLKTPGSELEKLERYIETKAALFVQHIPTARLYFAQTTTGGSLPMAGLDQEARTIYERVLSSLESIIRSAIRRKLILNVDPRMLVLGLEGLSNAFLVELVERPDDFSAEMMAGMTKTIFFERIRLKAKQI